MNLMRSLDKRFAFSHREESPEKEDASKTTTTTEDIPPKEDVQEDPSHHQDASPPKVDDEKDGTSSSSASVSLEKSQTIEELKLKLEEAESKASSAEEKLTEESGKAKLYHDRAIDATKEAVSLKSELRATKAKQVSLENANEDLRKELEEKQRMAELVMSQFTEANEKAELYQNQATDATKRATLLKVELDACTVARNSLEKTVEELKRVAEEVEMKVDYPLSENEAMVALDKANSDLKEELEASRTRVNDLQGTLNSIKADKDDMSANYEAKLMELQKSYGVILAEKEDMSRQLYYTRKTVDDLRHRLSMEGVELQSHKEAVSKKELERQLSVKQFQKEVDAKDEHIYFLEMHIEDLEKKLRRSEDQKKENVDAEHQQVILLEKKVSELEQKLQQADAQQKERDIEEQKRIDIINSEFDELKKKANQTAHWESKVTELVGDLHLLQTKYAGDKLQPVVEMKTSRDAPSIETTTTTEAPISSDKKCKSGCGSSSSSGPKGKCCASSSGTKIKCCASSSGNKSKCCTLFTGKHSMTLKCIVGVALLSILLGVLFNKRVFA